jgi:Na+/phosphate symporter
MWATDIRQARQTLLLARATTTAQGFQQRTWLKVLRKFVFALGGLLMFMIALQLMKEGAGSYGRALIGWLHVSNPANSLGLGWLLAYGFLSGSPVAAVAISFFAAGTLNGLQTFTMITGSRLGASFIVLFVGFLYYLRGQRHPASISTGVLALLTTAMIYIPALLPGFWLLHMGWLGSVRLHAAAPLQSAFDSIMNPVVALMTHWLPGWGLLLCGAAALLLAFNLLDRALPDIHAEHSGFGRIGRLVYRPMAMFLLGAVVTVLTMSVSVSIAVLVPLSVKGLVRRENILPYIMGANITTFIDTLVAALLIGGPAAFTIVLVEMVSVAALSLLVLLCCYRPFERVVLHMQEQIVASRTTLVVFLAIMLLVPLLLLVL